MKPTIRYQLPVVPNATLTATSVASTARNTGDAGCLAGKAFDDQQVRMPLSAEAHVTVPEQSLIVVAEP